MMQVNSNGNVNAGMADYWCEICKISFIYDESSIIRHNGGIKHAKKLAGHQLLLTLSEEYDCFEQDPESGILKCLICSFKVSNSISLEAHLKGSRHMNKMIDESLKENANAGICNIENSSPTNSEAHLRGTKHKNKIKSELNGKTKSSPINSEAHLKGAKQKNKKKRELNGDMEARINDNGVATSTILDAHLHCSKQQNILTGVLMGSDQKKNTKSALKGNVNAGLYNDKSSTSTILDAHLKGYKPNIKTTGALNGNVNAGAKNSPKEKNVADEILPSFKKITIDADKKERISRDNHQQILKLIKEIEFQDDGSRENIRVRIETFLQQHFPSVNVFMFGSSVNNLGFKGCDLDLYVGIDYSPWTSVIKSVMEKNPGDVVKSVAKLLEKEKIGSHFIAITGARVPIIKFKDKKFGINVDLSFKNRMPVYNTELISLYTKAHKHVRPYLMVIRYWAKIQGVAGGAQPTNLITNYAFTMMMLWYLMFRSPPIVPIVSALQNSSEKKNLVDGWNCSFSKNVTSWREKHHIANVLELIEEFFTFFGEKELEGKVISPLNGTFLDRHAKFKKNFKNTPLFVQDPFEHSLNITRGLSQSSLKAFQEKCKFSGKICEGIMNGSHPLDKLFRPIHVHPEGNIQKLKRSNTRKTKMLEMLAKRSE